MAPVQRAADPSGTNADKTAVVPTLSPEETLQRSINDYTEYYVKLGELRKQNEQQVEPLKLQNLEAQRLRQIAQDMYKEQHQYSSKIRKVFDDSVAAGRNPPDVFTASGDVTTAQAARGWWDHDAALIRMFFGRQTYAVHRHKILAGGKQKNVSHLSNKAKKQRVNRTDFDDELVDGDVMGGAQLFSDNEEDAEAGADDAIRGDSKTKTRDDADDGGETSAADKETRMDKQDAGSDEGADDEDKDSVGSDLDDLDGDENGIDVNDAFDMEEGAMDFEDEG